MKIIDAGNKTLAVLGTARLFIQAEQLRVARKSIEFAVIEGGYEKEILVSLSYLKKWDMVHSSFPFQTISDFCNKNADTEINNLYAYSALSPSINEKVALPPPSEKCKDLREKFISKWKNTFREKLSLHDRMNIKPVKIELKPNAVPCYNARAYDTPYHLREPYEREIKDMVDGGLIEPCGLDTSMWCSRAFLVLKSDKKSCRVVADFKLLTLTRRTSENS